jgi:UDP-N-acetylglucosamine diphosphorylase/glucosamine-1-phosphate N-acetyltransferase
VTPGLLVLFEDALAARFEPVALTRSVAGLRHGAWTHRERQERLFPDRAIALVARGAVEGVERAAGEWAAVGEIPPADAIFVAAALGRVPAAVRAAIAELPPGHALVAEGRLVAARAAGDSAVRLAAALKAAAGSGFGVAGASDAAPLVREAGLRARDVDVRWPGTLVDLLGSNADAIAEDAAAYDRLLPSPDPFAHPGAHFVRPDRIRAAEGVRIDPGAVLDASEGPILVGPRTRVFSGAVLTGPLAIGPDCRIKPLARVSATSAGPACRIGGEVDGSIVLGHSNKQHDGFLGHSYLGAWVNLGAATDTSDLKNDYGPVRVTVAGETIDTGERHVGSLIGDHTKTAIHTRLNTGSVIGVGCNVLGADFPPKAIPSFCWGGDGSWSEYRLDKALQVARLVMERRDVRLDAEGEKLLTALHAATAASRRDFLGTRPTAKP